ncbi:MAG: type II toxin-antitoxin system ParD family antitoxin [Bacteroidota bacterium]
MGKNTSIALGEHLTSFIEHSILHGRFNNTSEVVRAGLRLLENEENRLQALKTAINEGIESGTADGFDPEQFLTNLKAERKQNGQV